MTGRERVPVDNADPQTWYARGLVLLGLGGMLLLVAWLNRPAEPWLLLDLMDGLGFAILGFGALSFAAGVALRLVRRRRRRRR
ncbi:MULTISPECIES: hypothetical protein [unclassified Streptomyces]|uniref:hypothetical protein n=1 Tax=unclassified Streptomyces TaxID=2593676 RepID=UPI000DC77BE5|nr:MULTISPECIES: hypothetical protein [unclassified Streptomyces]AWZ08265.1 hypothetical protein DRB89_30870 [Streptomyces sp. ICC4]AWZ16076.1 hypothetical protein DRB96_31805 [Streptomyces sp. ICC1]